MDWGLKFLNLFRGSKRIGPDESTRIRIRPAEKNDHVPNFRIDKAHYAYLGESFKQLSVNKNYKRAERGGGGAT